MFDVMNDLSELIYIADVNTYELLYMNAEGRERFGVLTLRPGEKCYTVLQGRDSPCPFCTNARLTHDEHYTWEFTNPITGAHYLLKDRLVEWQGVEARMEIAFDITEKEAQRQMLEQTIEAQNTVVDCVRTLYTTETFDQALPELLRRMGEFLCAERVYLFEITGEYMNNTHEWCAPDVTPEREHLQGLSTALIERWNDAFSKGECFILDDIETLRDVDSEEYEILAAQGIKRMVTAPLERDGVLIGYVGVDNPPVGRMKNISVFFQTLRYFLMSALRIEQDEALLRRLSYYDMLTGAYNRNRYLRDVEALAGRDVTLGVVYLDVNGLKEVNDRLGHTEGDRVLIECAHKAAAVFDNEQIYRVGGDEFIVLCPGCTQREFSLLVNRLQSSFEEGSLCSAAIGSQWAVSSRQVRQIAIAADAVMYEDKRNHYRYNSLAGSYRHVYEDLYGLLEPGALHRALSEQRFEIHLQPKIALEGGRLVGAEALVRYRTGEGELVKPDRFLPVLEDALLITWIDLYVFEQVCVRLAQWRQRAGEPVPISVNLSRVTLMEGDLLERLDTLCQRHGIDKRWLEIEIAGRREVGQLVDWKGIVERLHQGGFRVSVDDFGLRFVDLSLLVALECDELKFDRELVDTLPDNARACTALRTLTALCRQNGTRTTAEGIETPERLTLLRELGFDGLQGYLISHPLPMEQFEQRYLMASDHDFLRTKIHNRGN